MRLTPFQPLFFLSGQQTESPALTNERTFTVQAILQEPNATIWQKISKIVQIVFKTILSVFLYWFNPSLFAIGFITGIVCDEKVIPAIKKIRDIWKTQPWSACMLGGIASAISLPVSLATSSLLWASYLGATLSSYSQEIMQRSNNQKEVSHSADEISEKTPAFSGG